MKVLKGTSVASGIVMGTVCLYTNEIENTLPHYEIPVEGMPAEKERVRAALARARGEMSRMVQVARSQGDAQAADIFGAHELMIGDQSIERKIGELIETRKVNAEHAVYDVFGQYLKSYESREGHFKELTHDIADVRDRILAAFGNGAGKFKCEVGESRAVIVAARRLTPSMVLSIPREHVLAFVTEEGGYTSHATILARSYGVPILFGIDVEKELDCGMEAVVDGSAGKVIVSPDDEMRSYYGKKIDNIRKKKAVCEVGRELPPRTRSGQRITLKLNISIPGELQAVTDLPHDGIGLLRTEFLFMQRQRPPTEDEQFRVYRDILCRDGSRPVTVRLLDIGGDKLPPYLKLPDGVNTDLELRGAMAVDTFPELYETQLRALFRANPGNLKLLYPMVSDLSDLATFRQAVAQARKNLKEERVEFKEGKVPEGIMIETPAAVMLARELLSEVDFINIGTNDLLQYTLAASRGSALGEKRYHILHPALLKLIEIAAREAKKAKKEVCLCGEIGSFEEFYPVLLETGLSSFSVAASKFTDIKCELMHLRRRRGSALREKLYKTKTKEEADVYFRAFVE